MQIFEPCYSELKFSNVQSRQRSKQPAAMSLSFCDLYEAARPIPSLPRLGHLDHRQRHHIGAAGRQ